jgi:hypothetical protein
MNNNKNNQEPSETDILLLLGKLLRGSMEYNSKNRLFMNWTDAVNEEIRSQREYNKKEQLNRILEQLNKKWTNLKTLNNMYNTYIDTAEKYNFLDTIHPRHMINKNYSEYFVENDDDIFPPYTLTYDGKKIYTKSLSNSEQPPAHTPVQASAHTPVQASAHTPVQAQPQAQTRMQPHAPSPTSTGHDYLKKLKQDAEERALVIQIKKWKAEEEEREKKKREEEEKAGIYKRIITKPRDSSSDFTFYQLFESQGLFNGDFDGKTVKLYGNAITPYWAGQYNETTFSLNINKNEKGEYIITKDKDDGSNVNVNNDKNTMNIDGSDRPLYFIKGFIFNKGLSEAYDKYNPPITSLTSLGGKRKSKGKSNKVAKKPVVSQKKQSVYKEIFGKQMKIYKMPDSRKEYVRYKGELHPISEYKSLMKQKALTKPKPKPRNKI